MSWKEGSGISVLSLPLYNPHHLKYRIPIAFQQKIGIQFGTSIAGFVFDPRATLNGQLYRLQPLRTEGQGTRGQIFAVQLSKACLTHAARSVDQVDIQYF